MSGKQGHCGGEAQHQQGRCNLHAHRHCATMELWLCSACCNRWVCVWDAYRIKPLQQQRFEVCTFRELMQRTKKAVRCLQLQQQQAVHLGRQLPSHADGIGFEVVSKAEVAQHLKKAVVPCGDANILQIIGANALLCGCGPQVLALSLQQAWSSPPAYA